jgi:hypothetical protein
MGSEISGWEVQGWFSLPPFPSWTYRKGATDLAQGQAKPWGNPQECVPGFHESPTGKAWPGFPPME